MAAATPELLESWRSLADGAFCPVDPATVKYAVCNAPVNIAVIKYWGKRDEKLILPINSSLSTTLHTDTLATTTCIIAHPSFTEDRLWLNGKEERMNTERLQNCLTTLRGRAAPEWANLKIHVWTSNNFPTAAGLASSASGFACFAFTLAQLYNVEEEYSGELSAVARRGSGSACRSVYGGFVKWEMGVEDSGKDSIAVQVADEEHWPELQILVLVVSDHKKDTSSTDGMQITVKTSPLVAHRAAEVVPARMKAMEEAIAARDFESFARLTMQDSNQFHSVCLDTYPPIFYMNDVSRAVIGLISKYNAASGYCKAAYTFDAGPNAVLYCLKKDMRELLSLVFEAFPAVSTPAEQYFSNQELLRELDLSSSPSAAGSSSAASFPIHPSPDALKYIMHTRVGPGPKVLYKSA